MGNKRNASVIGYLWTAITHQPQMLETWSCTCFKAQILKDILAKFSIKLIIPILCKLAIYIKISYIVKFGHRKNYLSILATTKLTLDSDSPQCGDSNKLNFVEIGPADQELSRSKDQQIIILLNGITLELMINISMEIVSLEPSWRELSNEYKLNLIGPMDGEIFQEEWSSIIP